MARRYKVDDGGAVAFRKTAAMGDRSAVHAQPGEVIVAEARSGEGQEEWVRHTNGLWLPVQFLVALDEEAGVVGQERQAAGAAAQAGSAADRATGAASEGESSLVADGAAAAAAVDEAKNAQRHRLERLPAAPSTQARPSARPRLEGLKLELSPGAVLPSEPHLKYLRLGGKVADSLRRSDKSKAERATDLDANEKLLALATRSGAIHVLDLSGGSIRRFDTHSMEVHAVHIDQDGEHIASCSNEGRAVIHELYGHDTQVFDYGEALTCVRLAPGYTKQNEFAAGSFDGHVRLKNKNWFGQMKDEDVHSDEGKIEEIAWQQSGAFLAWASDAGVKVWDCQQRQMMGHVPCPHDLEGDSQRCSLCWADERTLLIGWGHVVSVIEIRDREVTPGTVRRTDSSGLPNYMVTVAAKIELEQANCCGVAPFGGALMVLCVPTHDSKPDPVPGDEPVAAMESIQLPEYVSIARGMVREGFEMDSKPVGALEKGESVHALEVRMNDAGVKRVRFARGWTSELSKNGQTILQEISAAQAQAGARRPQLRILTTAGQPLLIDVLDVRDFRGAQLRDYRLRYTPSTDDDLEMFFIMAPHDILVVKRRDAADHVDFLLHSGDTKNALRVAQSKFETGEVGRGLLLQISHRWIEQLFGAAKYAEAARQCSELLGDDVTGWERWIYAFAERRQLREVAPGFCAAQSQFKLKHQAAKFSPAVYEMILHLYIDSRASVDHAMLYELLQRWPTEWYDSANIIAAVTEKLRTIGAFGDFASSSADDEDQTNACPTKSIGEQQTQTTEQKHVGLADCLALLLTQRGQHLPSLELRLALAMAVKRRAVKGSAVPSASVQKRIDSRAKRVFDYIDGHGLHMFLCPLLRPLMELHSDHAMSFFIRHLKQIPINDVASQLQTGREEDTTQLHTYLHKVFTRDPHGVDGKAYHTSHVEWLAQRAEHARSKSTPLDVDPGREQQAQEGQDGQAADSRNASGSKTELTSSEEALLKFLKTSPYYGLEHSLEICQTKKLHHCTIYLLGRMGRSREALDVIFDELHDMSAAIAFAKSRVDEPRLWSLLLERALAEPGERAGEYVGQLLTSAGQSVDPLMLIDRIPEGLEIPRMRDKLVMILRDYSFATRMHAGCVQVAERDGFALAMDSVRARRRAVCYHPSEDHGKLTAERVEKPDTLRGASTVRVKRRAVGALNSQDAQERAELRRQRLEAARMSRDEFASLYLQPNQQGMGRLVDYKPLASPQIERSRLCHLTGLNGQLEASGVVLPTTRSTSMEKLSAQAASLIDADDDAVGLVSERSEVMSPEAAAIAGLEMPPLGLLQTQDGQRNNGHSNAGSDRLRPSGDSTEDLQQRVATALALAENAMASSTSPSPTSPGLPPRADIGTSMGSPELPALDMQEHGHTTQEAQDDDMQAGDKEESSVSLASILGNSLSEAEGPSDSPQKSEEPISLVEIASGSEVAVESIGVSVDDVMALIDST